ncbi:uncharacterized protein HKW66_Vig0244790 [Vigna angularis]|uniref:Uncharacterized protein n=1 Tax=Phaseolus angularis TaxID=3914 RepID=A0A8T0L015_PHAAN|nr:uncharacterized protein HKW66_Vig0244790 [Vigna angularis]
MAEEEEFYRITEDEAQGEPRAKRRRKRHLGAVAGRDCGSDRATSGGRGELPPRSATNVSVGDALCHNSRWLVGWRPVAAAN